MEPLKRSPPAILALSGLSSVDDFVLSDREIELPQTAKMPRSIITAAAATLLGLASGALAADNTTFGCTFSGPDGYLQISQAKNSCSDIVLDSLEIPGGVTLNLEKLNDGTTVRIAVLCIKYELCTDISLRSLSRAALPGPTLNGKGHSFPSPATTLRSRAHRAMLSTGRVPSGGMAWAAAAA